MYRSTQKYYNEFFERWPQIASVLATEVGDVGSLSRHSGTRSQCASPSEDKGCAELPLPSCAIAVDIIVTTASTNVVQVHITKKIKVCKMESLVNPWCVEK